MSGQVVERVFLWVGLLVCALLAGPARAADDGRERIDAWRAARTSVAPALEAHAAWCNEQKLRGERDAAYAGLLALAPDHAKARKTLRFRKDPSGGWVQGSYRAPKPTRDPALAKDAAERLARAVAPLRSAVVALRETKAAPVLERERATEELALVLSGDEEVRGWNGEVRAGDDWLLRETVRARKEGAALRATVTRLLAEQPAIPASEPHTEEELLCAAFHTAAETEGVRAVATRGSLSAVEGARIFEAVGDVFEAVFGQPPTSAPRVRVLLFANAKEGLAAFERHPHVDAAHLAWASSLTTAWPQSGNDVFVWAEGDPQRKEWVLRQALQFHDRVTFRVNEKHGWIYEGTGHWLAEAMLGSHLTWYVRRDGYADGNTTRGARLQKLLEPGQDWLALAAQLLASPERPDLRVLLGRDVNTMNPDELLVAYALVRFLFEGRGTGLADLFDDVGEGHGPDAWCDRHLGWTVEGLERRLVRWTAEMTAKRR